MPTKEKDPDALADRIRAAEHQLADLRREQSTSAASEKPKRQARARGSGNVFRPHWIDRVTGERRESPRFHLRYRVPGKGQVREATEATSRAEAERILRKRLEDLEAGRPVGPQLDRTTVGEVLKGLLTDLTVNGRRSLDRVKRSVKHLQAFFGEHTKARSLDEARVDEFVARRLRDGAANASVNRDLVALRRALRLAHRSFRIGRILRISMLKEARPRSGFVERAQLDAILAHLPADVRPVVEVGYITGWRMASEVLTREWRHVDLKAGWLRLAPMPLS